MIVHLCSDDTLIDEYVIDMFNILNPNNNVYIIVTTNKTLTNIKRKEFVTIYSPDDVKILAICNSSKAVIIHAFYGLKWYWVSKIKKNVKVLWSCWGKDLYETKEFNYRGFSLYEPETKKTIKKNLCN